MEYALSAKVKGGMSMRARSAPGGKETSERLSDVNAPGASMTWSRCGCDGCAQVGVRRDMLRVQQGLAVLWIAGNVRFGCGHGRGLRGNRQDLT